MRCIGMAVIVACAGLVGGCNEFLAEHMVLPPNGRGSIAEAPKPSEANELVVPVGPPEAALAVWVLEPKTAPRATVLVLHGFIADHHTVENAGRALRDAGYRAVMVDLRGHGESTGEHITYGVQDARDLQTLTNYLQAHQLCGDTIGVYGTSYGAASALLFAGSDPRVKAVVAVAPFASLREEAPYFGKHLLPVPGLFMSDADFSAIVSRMGQLAGFDPEASRPIDAIRKTQAHVRLFTGDIDMIVKPEQSQELAAADPERAELTVLKGKGHLELCFDPFGELQQPTREWFDKYLAMPIKDDRQAMMKSQGR